ncbi:MAG TPA: YceI family protein [Bryobacteraceae bacterium]|nr:YceI family protein [Bryobacteraceae bacterium]
MKLFSNLAFTAGLFAVSSFAAQWNIDPGHSSASFAVRHMMVSTVHGSFSGLKGTVDYDPSNVAASKVSLTIDATTVDTRNENRDKDLKSPNFFDISKYPSISFASKRIVPGSAGKFQLIGDMTMHGVTKEVTFDVEGPAAPIKDARGNLHSGATATTRLNRKDFGLIWNKTLDGGGAMVGDDVDVTVEVELVQMKPAGATAN